MPMPTLVVRTMRRADFTAVVDLITTTAVTLRIYAHTDAHADRRRLILDVLARGMQTGNVDIAVQTTGSRVATATRRTLLGVTIVTAHPSDGSKPQPHTGLEGLPKPVERLQQLSGLRRDHESSGEIYHALQYLAVLGSTPRDDVVAALLHVMHTRLDNHSLGCYVHVHDDESRACLQHHGYIDIGEPLEPPHDAPAERRSGGRHLWRHPAPTANRLGSRSSNTDVPTPSQRPRGTWTTSAVQKEVRRLYDDYGWTATKIAAYLGCNRTTVTGLLRKHRDHKSCASLTPAILHSYQQGLESIHSIALRIGCTYDTAHRLLRAAGATILDEDNGDLVIEIADRYTRRQQSIKQIATDLGQGYNYIRKQLLAAEVKLRQHGGARKHRDTP